MASIQSPFSNCSSHVESGTIRGTAKSEIMCNEMSRYCIIVSSKFSSTSVRVQRE